MRTGIEWLGRRLGPRWHLRRLRRTLLCPVYHIVREDVPDWWQDRYRFLTPAEFERDMETLLSWGRPVDAQEMVAWARGHGAKPDGFFLSFDDGYRELHDIVAPVLLRKGVPATFFLCTSLIDHRGIYFQDQIGLILRALRRSSAATQQEARKMAASALGAASDQCGADAPDRGFGRRIESMPVGSFRSLLQLRTPGHDAIRQLSELLQIDSDDFLRTYQPYLTGPQIERLISQGFAVGSHSIEHPVYENLTLDEQLRQTVSSVDEIASRFSLDYRLFAFPYGDFGVSSEFYRRLFGGDSDERQKPACWPNDRRTDWQSVLRMTPLLPPGSVDLCFGTRGMIRDELEPRVVQRTLCDGRQGTLRRHFTRQFSEQWVRSLVDNDMVRRRK
jgi:peptidoglycan/xylan/chitin deacetylase (PgdA/CDA1 family)